MSTNCRFVRSQLVDSADEALDVGPQLGQLEGVLGAKLLQFDGLLAQADIGVRRLSECAIEQMAAPSPFAPVAGRLGVLARGQHADRLRPGRRGRRLPPVGGCAG
ncbi:hypothetical protein [Streptomyces cinerochromogenes]|uniref:hypothetical protein n=1 Tax=Streptomyces cinerochromogenes TaxID=66422 RepID=UPI00339F6D56